MIRRRAAAVLLGLGIVPALTACPAPPGAAPAAAPASAPAAPSDWSADMLAQVNAQRAAAGVGALSWCGTLSQAAAGHSADQAARDTMSHTGGDGSDIGVRANRAGYQRWTNLGENVAYGYGSVSAVMTGWMNSPGHRANLLSPNFTHVGFGRASSGSGTPYWTQDFGRNGTC